MRLINLRATPQQQPFPLLVVALGDSQDGPVCHHYRTTRDHETSMTLDGLEMVLASKQIEGGELPDGLTIDSILAICEDRARLQAAGGNNRLNLVALQLQAARRALATDESDEVPNLIAATGSDSRSLTHAFATA